MLNRNDAFIWTEKYRPKTIDDCVLPKRLKDVFNGYKEQGRIPTLLLSSGPGQGKCLGYNTELELLVSDEVYNLIKEKINYEV